MTSVWRGAHAEGREKGRKEGQDALLKELGISDLTTLRSKLGLQPQQGQPETPPPGQGGQWEKLALGLQTEVAERERREATYKAEIERYRAQDARALRAEIVADLIKAGAHPSGAEDLAHQLVPSPDGPAVKVVRSTDGSGYVVMERDPSGQYIPSKHPWSKYVEGMAKAKPHFWPTSVAGGSGGNNATAPGAGGQPGGSGWDFYKNIENLNRRGQR
jgi:hypothetical protein